MSTENPQQAQNPTLPVNPLTQEQLVVIKDLFTECDTNKDGVIDREELRSSIHKFVFNQSEQVTDEQLDILMKRLDTKDRGVVNFDDFVAGIMPLLAPKEKGRSLSKEQEDQMKSLFSSLERDENGRLDVNEIKGVLLTIFSIAQKHVTADQLEQLSHYVSKEEDDKDTVIETIQLFISTGVLQVPPGTKERTIRGTSVALLKQYRRKMDEIEVSRSNSGSRNNSIIKNEMQELTSIMNEKTALEEQLRRLREEGQHLREVNNGLLDKVSKLEDENKEFKKRSKALEKVRDSNKELQEQIDAMKIELDELRRTQKETKKYQIRYSQENEDLQKKLSEKEKMLQNSKTEVLSMAQQLQQIKAVERPSSPKPVLQRLSASANHEQDEAAKIRSLLIKIEQLTKANRETQDMLESANSNISKLKASLEEHQIETAKSTTHKELPPESFLLELAHEIQSPSPSRSITPGLGGPPQWPLQNAPPPSVFPPSIIRSEYQAKQMQNVSQGKKAPIKISQQSTMVKYQRTSMADAQPKQKAKGSKPQNQNQKQPEQQQANASEQKQQKQPKPKNENKKADAENKKPEQVNKEQANNKENSKQEKPQVPPSKEEVQAPASTEPQANNNNNSNPSQPQTNAKEKKPKAPKKEAVTGRGQVKAVPSGDTVVVIHLEKNRPPVERKITLSNIRAPKLGLRTFTEKKEDEDFAWQSREFLRKLTIEKPVSYTIEGTSKDGSRDFGLVHLIDKEGKTQDIAALIVAEGWAEVTTKTGENNTSNRPDVEELNRLEEIAKRDNKGQWNKNTKKDKKRPIVEINNIPEVYERLKGHPQHGIVENVINGNTVILTITPQFYDIKLNLSGVECPGYDDYGAWEPFGREARFTTEFLLLHRDVQVIFEGADKFNLYGSLNYHGRNIGEELLRRGLAKFVDWSGNKTAFRDKLKAAEKQAVEQKAGIWSTAQPSAKVEDKKGWKPGKEVHGKVVEVVSAGVIVVEDNKNRHRINLSSIRALRGGSLVFSKDEEKREEGKAQEKSEKELQKEKRHRAEFLEKTYAHEGKEYLRKRLIGQKVRCVLDYSRPPLPSNENKEEKGKKEEDKLYWSVYFEKNNVAVEIVANGFARATEHRAGDLRSKDYEDILKAENLATKSHRGIHTPDEKAAITYISDATSDATKARKFLASLKRSKQRGVVEYVAHASRFKLYVPKESCEMFINIAGIKTPRTPKEKFFQESLDFIKEKLFQRDVEFEVVNVDKGGSFLGTIWFNRENIATSLLSQGFATIIKAVARDSEYFNDYRAAEDAAKRNRKHLWEDYDEEAEKAAAQKRRQDYESEKKKAEVVDVIVTEIIDATKFYVQIVGKEAEKLEEVMKQLAAQDPATEPYSSKFGDIVAAQFTADDAWYRAKNNGETPDGQVKVFYIDYGNSEVIPKSRVRKLPEDFDIKKLPPQAFEAHLAYVKPPALNQEYGQEAAEFFKELVEGKTLYASIEFRDGNTLYLTMGDNAQLFVNAAIVRAGLARVERVKGAREAMAKLKAEEEKARLSHNYIWEYGDPGSDEEDQPLRPSAKQAKAPPKKKAEEPKKEGKEEKKESE